MTSLLRSAPILSAVVGCLTLGNSLMAEQVIRDQPEIAAFTGIHARRGVGGKPNTARITDRKTFMDVTEQEYRERGYVPPYDKLPVLIIQRLPVLPRHEN
jgi:hypothetical protein